MVSPITNEAYHLLLAVAAGCRIGTQNGQAFVYVTKASGVEIKLPFDEYRFAELEARDWVEMLENKVKITESGRYWLHKHARKYWKEAAK